MILNVIRVALTLGVVVNFGVTGYLSFQEHHLPTFLQVEEIPEINGALQDVAVPCLFANQVGAAGEMFAHDQKEQEQLSRCYREI